jgi:hypothetical protein|tara:strand:- start:188 stop:385 length:198 start_codon:yes stop_codon:yes gene_type:complete
MFNWFNRKDKEKNSENKKVFEEKIEQSLWDMKEPFDLETEEVERTILETRQNLEHIRKKTSNKDR